MYKDPHYHRRFPHLLYLSALTPLLLYLFNKFIIDPQLAIIVQNLGAPMPHNSYTLLIIISLVSLLQIPLGYILNQKINTGASYKNLLLIATLVLTVNFFLAGYTLTSAINAVFQPIYNLTDYIK
jgi:hypothetical protein